MSAFNLNAAAQSYGYNSNAPSNDDEGERGGSANRGKTAKIGDRVTYLTRALVKNNIVGQNAYLGLLALEYLCMIYYILRLADNKTLNQAFNGIESFLDVSQVGGFSYSQIQLFKNGQISTLNKTGIMNQNADGLDLQMENIAYIHFVINFTFFGIYTFFTLTFVARLLKVDTFDKTQEQSYILKGISLFMVLSKTIFKLPILSSILIAIKIMVEGMQKDLFFVALVINTILIIEFFLVVIYSLKFFNLEVPNDDIAWSHNTSNGLYFKLMLKITLCSQELYRNQLNDTTVCIICMVFILILEILIIMYRMNTPNIFNSLVHDFTLFLESLIISLTVIGLIALVTGRDILSTLAYLCIFIPIIIKIFYSIDQSRKHFVLFKLKNEDNLSGNEYLIALTSLLKMIKRQSETDMAQMLSFTYYHKLYCYDTGCICQFFTQYCQDPIKFKQKKKRTYRGYKDDGMKLIQIQDGQDDLLHNQVANTFRSAEENSLTTGQQQPQQQQQQQQQASQDQDTSHSALLSKVLETGGKMHPQITQRGPGVLGGEKLTTTVQDITNFSQITTPVGGTARQTSNLQGGTSPNTPLTNQQLNYNEQLYDSNLDGVAAVERNAAINYDQVDLSAAQVNGHKMEEDQDAMGMMMGGYGQSNGNVEFKEKGISSLFTKGQILRGNAFNGFDSNLDFKIKGEFKSPSQFKTVEESRTYFFTRLLETMFKQLEQRTSKNTSFVLISIYFHFFYQHNVYLAAFNLVKLAKALNRSTLQKMSFSVTEYYLLEQIMSNFKHNTKDEIDYQSFIESSQMQQRLDWLFEDTSQEIVQFWRIFKEDQANVKRSYHLAMNISKNISVIRDYTTQLEEKQLIKDYNKYYYYAMFYQNLLNDKQAYNQMINNLRNLLVVRNIQKKNSRFGINSQDINDIGFAILSIEEAGPQDKNVGRFIYCNKAACSQLSISEEDVIGKSVINIMPEHIRIHHELFVKRFYQDGLTRLVGKVRNMYVRDFKGYIKPVQFFFNFYYSSKFSYSCIVHIDPIQTLTYHGSTSVINVKHCMIFLCQDDNTIMNMTENVKKILGLGQKRLKEEEEILGRGLKIEDVVQNFNRIENVISTNKITFLPNQMVRAKSFRGEATAAATTAYLKSGQIGASEISYMPCSLTYEEVTYLKDHPGVFTIKVFILIPNTKVPELDTQSLGLNSVVNSQQNQQNEQSSNNFDGFTVSRSTSGDDNAAGVNNGGMSASVSSLGSSSSIASSSGIANTKNLLFTQKSPKILNLYLTIVFGVFLSFMVITSINFIIYLQKKNNVNLQIQVNQIISQRNAYLSSTFLNLKQLHLMSQPYKNGTIKSNMSNILPPPNNTNRFGHYGQLFLSDQEVLQNNHEFFKKSDQIHTEITNSDQINKRDISFKLISDLGRPYFQNNTLDFGVQLLISNLAMIKPEAIMQEKLPLDLDTYLSGLNGKQKVSQLLKNMYYVYYNGMSSINSLTQLQNELMLESTLNTSQNNNLFINLISFISIGMITFIGIFTFPMLGKIEDRKISVLKFFNLLSVEQIQTLIKKGEDYRDEFQNLQKSVINGGKRGMSRSGGEEDEDKGSDDDDDEDGDMAEQEQIAEEYGISRVQQEYGDSSNIKIDIKINGQSQSSPYSVSKSVQKGNSNESSIKREGNNAMKQPKKSSFAMKYRGVKGQPTSEFAKDQKTHGTVSFKGQSNEKQTKSSFKQQQHKGNISNNAKDDGIRDIFKKIRQNEDQMKEYGFRKNKTGKFAGSSTAHMKSTKYALSLEEELKQQNDGTQKLGSTHHHHHLKRSHKDEKVSNAKRKKKENEDNVVKGYRSGGSSASDNENNAKNNNKNEANESNDTSGEDEDDEDDDDKKRHKKKHGNDSKDKQDLQAQVNANNRINHINNQLERVALREKVKLAFYVLIVLAFLNSCLIACFSIGQKTFSDDSKAVFTLTTFYHRQNCVDNLMLYSLEQFIQNKTIDYLGFEWSIKGQTADAVWYYIKYCQKHELEFNNVRKELPIFLKNAATDIENLESSNICKTIYKVSETKQIADCERVYDEILKRGLTSTMYTIFNYAQSLNVRFQKESRTQEFLNKVLYEDQKFRDLIDIVKSYLHSAFQYIQVIVTNSSVAYFDSLARNYMIIYSCYMGFSILMCLIFGLFIFKKLRQQIITSANILAIMPLEELDSRERQKIEIFLNS